VCRRRLGSCGEDLEGDLEGEDLEGEDIAAEERFTGDFVGEGGLSSIVSISGCARGTTKW
jgi:hypothetical protein